MGYHSLESLFNYLKMIENILFSIADRNRIISD
jgi:hypothetical protein